MKKKDDSEVMIVDPKTGGQKGQKIHRFDLIPGEPLMELAKLYGKGAMKHGDDNWRKGYRWTLSFGAMMRHAWLFWLGESVDACGPKCEEGCQKHTNCHHLSCAAFHCFSLMWFDANKRGTDDRPDKRKDANE